MAVQVTLCKSSTVQYMSIIHCALDLIKENNHKKKNCSHERTLYYFKLNYITFRWIGGMNLLDYNQ